MLSNFLVRCVVHCRVISNPREAVQLYLAETQNFVPNKVSNGEIEKPVENVSPGLRRLSCSHYEIAVPGFEK